MSDKRLLIVDDEPDVVEFIRRVAEGMDYKVAVATRTDQFRERYTSFDPTAILIDMVMPDANGTEMAQWLADRRCSAQVIVTTGYDRSYAEVAVRLGQARGLVSITALIKPFGIDNLRAILGSVDI